MAMMNDPPISMPWETPEHPCDNCVIESHHCKRNEDSLNGSCSNCIALGMTCSLGVTVYGNLHIEPAGMVWPISGADRANTFALELGEPGMSFGHSSFADMLSQSTPSIEVAAVPMAMTKAGTPLVKIGARFSRESVRILKNWLVTHNRHPYPTEEEREMLQRQTGLNKTQITNWLANARRRGKAQPPRPTSPGAPILSGSMDIPLRRGTPAMEAMNPMERWEHSPPEHEPASVSAIARAVTASDPAAIASARNSPYSFHYTDDSSNKSLCNQSSASSVGTSQSSNGSLASVYSHGTQSSWGSLGSTGPFSSRGRRRRRRKTATKKKDVLSTSLTVPAKTFQCTFCTETFRTKHDWQRHEKSLHLSLERWVCALEGPRAVNADKDGSTCCVFCGEANPSDAHIDTHNHATCQGRALEERTFYRKDHLNQHLRLVHDVKFMDWSMKGWKVATPEIWSRCGFCGIIMETWSIRIDHLAEHFKTGYSMADWKGDWGFEPPVLDMVENSMPPYLIHHERQSPNPYAVGKSPPASPRNAYELIKLELAYFGTNYWEQHERAPTDEDMMLEGCRIIFASELLSLQGIATQPSWLRDLIMSNSDIAQKARFGPLRGAAENRLQTLKINGKDNLFEFCPMETQLHAFVKAKRLLGLTAMDDELQEEACRIVGRVEEVCTHPSEAVANWLLRMIQSSTDWLPEFRKRAHLPRSEDVHQSAVRSTDPTSIDSTIHNFSRLESELADFLKQRRSLGIEPTDEDLQREARMIIYEFDDGWNQTVADNLDWLAAFRERNWPVMRVPTPRAEVPFVSSPKYPAQGCFGRGLSNQLKYTTQSKERISIGYGDGANLNAGVEGAGAQVHDLASFLSDANCYHRLAKELRRWVVSTMSPNNPSQHVPSDEELRYQARWIIYDDGDPWNQTAADNAEWLQRFKRDVGILQEGPGLPVIDGWALEQGGTGFAPPYAYPKSHSELPGGQSFAEGHSPARFPEGQPATVFCSRELERGLEEHVKQFVGRHGCFPSDAELQDKAREISKSDNTAADDVVLLNKFKEWVQQRVSYEKPAPALPTVEGMRLDISDEDLDKMCNDLEMEFLGEDHWFGELGVEDDGGASLAMAATTRPSDALGGLFEELSSHGMN